jgi:hypothetical protein
MPEITCPICNGGTLARGDGRLEQSGDSYLPTVVWSCGCCGYARFEPALSRKWRPAEELAPAGSVSTATASAPPGVPQPLQAASVKSRRAA